MTSLMRSNRLVPSMLMNRLSIWFATLLLLLITGLGSISVAQAQQGLQPIPKLDKLVVDQAEILSLAEEEALRQKLWAFEKAKGSQIAIVTVPTTAPEDIFSYSQRAAETYKLGRQGVGDGVLIVVAANDRKVWIYVMRSLEGAIPDVVAKRVTDEYITPAFKQGQYAAGLDAGTTQLMKLIEGESLPPPKNQQSSNDGAGFLDMLVMIGSLAIIGSGIASATSRWLVAPPAGGIAGLIAYSMTSVTGWGWIAGITVSIFILIFGGRSYQMSTQRSANRNNDVFWGGGFGGGSGGWGGGGGFGGGGGWGGSGGGGDAGGGGAGGSW